MIHLHGQFESRHALAGVRPRFAAYLYSYYYAPVSRTVSCRGVPKA